MEYEIINSKNKIHFNNMSIIKKWFEKIRKAYKRKSFNLRQACIDKYGEEFGELYDSFGTGTPIGGFLDTVAFIDMVEAVKKESGLWY